MAASLSGLKPMHGAGGDIPLPNVTHIKAPYQYRHGAGMKPEAFGAGRRRLARGRRCCEIGPDNVAAFIAEPAQSAGGAIVPRPDLLAGNPAICRSYDILLIVDEVVMGFGRTGDWFGSDSYGINPDIMQLGKAITSGYLPLSATVISDRVADVLIDTRRRVGAWLHLFRPSGLLRRRARKHPHLRRTKASSIARGGTRAANSRPSSKASPIIRSSAMSARSG